MLLQRHFAKRPSIKQILSWFKEPPVLIKEGEGGAGRRKGMEDQEDAKMQKMRESRKQKKEEYELLQRKLKQQMTLQREHHHHEEKEAKEVREASGINKTRERAQSDPRDLSGRADEDGNYVVQHSEIPRNLSEGDENASIDAEEEEKQRHKKRNVSRPATSAGERQRQRDRGEIWVPEPQLSTRQIIAGKNRIENELRRKKLQLRNMKQISELSESLVGGGGENQLAVENEIRNCVSKQLLGKPCLVLKYI